MIELIKYFQQLDDDIQYEKINLYTTDELNKDELKKNLLILKDIINSKFSKSFNEESASLKKTIKSQLDDLKKNVNNTLKIIDNNNYSLSESDEFINDLGIIDQDFINYFEPVKKKPVKKKPVKKEVKKTLNQLKKDFSLLLSALKGKKNALDREQSYTNKNNEKIEKLKNELKEMIKKYKETQELIKQMEESKEKEIIEKKEKKNNNKSIDTNKTMAVNPWIEHVRKCRAEHPEWTYRQALTECKKTYKKNVETKAKPTKKTKKSKINVEELLEDNKLPPLPKTKPPKGHFIDGKFYPYPDIPAPPIPKKQKNLSDKIKKFMDKYKDQKDKQDKKNKKIEDKIKKFTSRLESMKKKKEQKQKEEQKEEQKQKEEPKTKPKTKLRTKKFDRNQLDYLKSFLFYNKKQNYITINRDNTDILNKYKNELLNLKKKFIDKLENKNYWYFKDNDQDEKIYHTKDQLNEMYNSVMSRIQEGLDYQIKQKQKEKPKTKLKEETKEDDKKYAVYDDKTYRNKKNVILKPPFVCDDVDKKLSFNTKIFNNPKDMTKYSGSGWKLQFGFHRQKSKKYNNPLSDKLKGSHVMKFNNKKNDEDRHIIVSISKDSKKPDHHIYLSHISTDLEDVKYKDKKTYNLHINFVSVHKDGQGQGLSKKTFYFLFSYLDYIKTYPDTIDLEYAASHQSIIKTYTEMMALFGYKNKIFDMVFNDDLIYYQQYEKRLEILHRDVVFTMQFDKVDKEEQNIMCNKITKLNNTLTKLKQNNNKYKSLDDVNNGLKKEIDIFKQMTKIKYSNSFSGNKTFRKRLWKIFLLIYKKIYHKLPEEEKKNDKQDKIFRKQYDYMTEIYNSIKENGVLPDETKKKEPKKDDFKKFKDNMKKLIDILWHEDVYDYYDASLEDDEIDKIKKQHKKDLIMLNREQSIQFTELYADDEDGYNYHNILKKFLKYINNKNILKEINKNNQLKQDVKKIKEIVDYIDKELEILADKYADEEYDEDKDYDEDESD